MAQFRTPSLSFALLTTLFLNSGATIAAPQPNSPSQQLSPLLLSQSWEEQLRQRIAESEALAQEAMKKANQRRRIAYLHYQALTQEKHNPKQALALLEEALKLARQYNDQESEADTFYRMGTLYLRQGDSTQAIRLLEQSLEIVQKTVPTYYMRFMLLIDMGDAYFLKGDDRQALQWYEQVIQTASTPTDKLFQRIALTRIGKVYFRQGNYTQAVAYADQSLQNNTTKDWTDPSTLHLKGRALFQMGQFAAAETTLRDAMKSYEELRLFTDASAVDNGSSALEFLEMQAAVGRVLQQVLIAQKKFEQALEIAEWGRSRVFAELLSVRLTPEEQKSPQQKVRERFKQQQIENERQYHKFQESGDLTIEQAQQRIEEIAQNQADSNLQTAETYKLLQTPLLAPPSIDQIRQVARNRKATIVEYSILFQEGFEDEQPGQEKQLLIWVVQPTGEVALRTVEITSLKEPLSKVVDQSRSAIGVRGRSMLAFRDTAAPELKPSRGKVAELHSLHQLLIQPIADLLPKDPNAHVIFVPQGPLFMVPFAALQDKDGKFLIERHTILTAPAIAVLMQTAQQREHLKTSRPATGSEYLIVGNPTMPSLALAPDEPLQQLSSLPGSEKEAKAIATLLNTQALIGAQATKATVIQQMKQARIIHLATHGLLDDIQGLGTPGAIALAPDDPNVKDSGFLTASEILGMQLNTELVVLSACDTGRGRITGDGVIGLSRSLVIAGVPSVVVSLWQVPDAPTATLMTQFYQNLQKNSDKAQALRQAMLSTMKSYPDPKAWAAFTLIGEAL